MRDSLNYRRKLLLSLLVSSIILFAFTGNFFQGAADTAALLSVDSSQETRELNGMPLSAYFEEHKSGNIYSEVLESLLWNAFFLLLPLWICWSLILCFGVRLPKRDFSDSSGKLRWLLCVLRYVLAVFILLVLLTYRTFWWSDVAQDYLYRINTLQNYLRWLFSWLIFTCILLDWKRLKNGICQMRPSTKKLIILLCVPYVCMAMIELLCASKLDMMPSMYILNYICWLLVVLFLYFLSRRIKVAALVTLVAAYFVGIANYVIFQLRGSYITFGDLSALRTALEVAGNYTFKPGVYFWIVLGIFLVVSAVIVCIRIPEPQKISVKHRAFSLLETAFVAAVAVCGYFSGMLFRNVDGVSWDYSINIAHVGYVPFFLSNMHEQSHVECEGYSTEAVLDALDSVSAEVADNNVLSGASDSDKAVSDQEPNIIIIQNEAFSDLSLVYDLETDRDILPYIHSLTENTVKGFLNLSVMVGPTANTEFEVLSRSSLAFLPYGCIPYSQYVKHSIPSLAEVLKNQKDPYHTVAYHSYYSSGYNRPSAYHHLGFEESVFENQFEKDFDSDQQFRGYVTDEANFQRVIQLYEKSKKEYPDNPFFCFNVTIQNHGGYYGDYKFNEPVSVTNFDAPTELETYLSLIRMSDEAFRKLIEYFADVDEPTILVMYGDHQPSFTDKDVELLSQHPAWENEQLQSISRHYVPYVIWANYDIEEADHMGKDRTQAELNTLSANYFSSTILQCANLELSSYDQYLLNLQKSIPALSAVGYWTADGTYYNSVKGGPYAEKLAQLQKIQYNLLIDNKDQQWEKFVP